MAALQLETLSSFGRLAVKLDLDLSELARISGQIQRLDIDSDSGLDRAVKLLDQFAQHGKNVSEGVQGFSRVLQEAHERSQIAATAVAERAQLIGERRLRQNDLRDQLGRVEQHVKAANERLSGFRKDGGRYSEAEQRQLKTELDRLNADLKRFLADALVIKESAGQAKFRNIERDAQSLVEALRSSCRKLDKI